MNNSEGSEMVDTKRCAEVDLPKGGVQNFVLRRLFVKYAERYMPTTYAKLIGVNFGEHCRFIGRNHFGSEPYLIKMGDYVSITSSTFITHDGGVWVFRNEEPDIDVVRPIRIGNNVFVGSNCTILPGVRIGDNVVVGASSVITKELMGGFVYAGNPAKPIKTIQEYRAKVNIFKVGTKNLSRLDKEAFFREKMVQN
jgi:acetyltransferase-like isoleucine patch superfamily enzyme